MLQLRLHYSTLSQTWLLEHHTHTTTLLTCVITSYRYLQVQLSVGMRYRHRTASVMMARHGPDFHLFTPSLRYTTGSSRISTRTKRNLCLCVNCCRSMMRSSYSSAAAKCQIAHKFPAYRHTNHYLRWTSFDQ